jgi:hypothetical protein
MKGIEEASKREENKKEILANNLHRYFLSSALFRHSLTCTHLTDIFSSCLEWTANAQDVKWSGNHFYDSFYTYRIDGLSKPFFVSAAKMLSEVRVSVS